MPPVSAGMNLESCVRVLFTSDQMGLVRDEDVVPLRPDLYLEAVRRWGAGRVLDVADLVPRRDVRRQWSQAVRATERFTRSLEDHPDPVYACAGTFMLEVGLLAFWYARTLFTHLHARYRTIRMAFDWTETGPWKPNVVEYNLQAYYSAALQMRAQGIPIELDFEDQPAIAAGRIGLQERLRVWMGRALHRIGPVSWLADSGPAPAWRAIPGPVQVLLGGLQVTDVALQGQLAGALARQRSCSSAWLKGTPSPHLERSEAAGLGALSAIPEVAFDHVPEIRWRHWWLVACSGAAVRDGLYRMWGRAAPGVRWSRRALLHLFETVGANDPAIGWFRMSRLLNRMSPRVVLGNSALHDMSAVAAWSRHRRVPFVLLPHGYPSDPAHLHHAGRGDAQVVFGPAWERLLRRGRAKAPAAVCSAGRLFLPPCQKVTRDDLDRRPRRVVFLENCDMANPSLYLYSARQYVEWLLGVGRAAGRAGWELVLRGHPRKPPGTFYEDMAARLRAEGVSCMVDAQADLSATVRGARLVVARLLDTAMVRALLVGTPLVGFDPACPWPPRRRWLGMIARWCRDEAELLSVFQEAVDANWLESEMIRQRERLRPWVDFADDGGFHRVARAAARKAAECDRSWKQAWTEAECKTVAAVG